MNVTLGYFVSGVQANLWGNLGGAAITISIVVTVGFGMKTFPARLLLGSFDTRLYC